MSKNTSHSPVTEDDVEALIDGELSPARQEVVVNALATDSWLRERYHNLRRQKMLLLSWWAQEAEG